MIRSGLFLILLGLFKKVAIADALGRRFVRMSVGGVTEPRQSGLLHLMGVFQEPGRLL